MINHGETSDRWEEALSWHVTLRESEEETLTNAVGREWQRWYSEAENRRIFDHLSRLLVERGLYRNRPRPSREEIEADRYDLSVPVAEWRRTHATHQTPKQSSRLEWNLSRLRWRSTAATFAALAALVMLSLSPLRMVRRAEWTAPMVYRTDVGGLKAVHLADGSSVILGGRSQLSIAFTAHQRSASLIRGQAWFRVTHNTHWPFIVTAGAGTITDVGTSFIVTRNSDRVVVTVTEGKVAVSVRPPLSAGSDQNFSPSLVLTRISVTGGEEVAFADDGVIGGVKSTDVHADTAWTHGRLMFHDQPLRYVVEAVDRYSFRNITVTPSAGALRFSGIIHEDEVDAWLQGLTKIFPIAVVQRGAADCIHMQDPGLSGLQSCSQ